MLKNLVDFFGVFKISEINCYDVRNYREKRILQGVCETTVNREQTILIHIYNQLSEWKRLEIIDVTLPDENPGSPASRQARRIVKKANELLYARKRVLTSAEINTFLKYCSIDLQRIIIMAVLTTLRLKDLKLLSRDNINTNANQLEGIQSKVQKPYFVPITPRIKAILNQAKGHKILNFHNFRRQFEEARQYFIKENPSSDWFVFKDFRRSGAKIMEKAGISLKVISEILGHSDLRMTQIYVPTTSEDRQKAVQVLADKLDVISA